MAEGAISAPPRGFGGSQLIYFYGTNGDRLRRWTGIRTGGRDLALYLGRERCGLRLAELGTVAGGIDYATVSNRLRQFEAATREDPKLKRVMKQALTLLEKGKM